MQKGAHEMRGGESSLTTPIFWDTPRLFKNLGPVLPRAGFIAQRRGGIVLRPDSEYILPYVLGAEQCYQQVGEGKKVPTVFRDPTVRCEMPRQMSKNYFWMKEEQNPKARLPNQEYLRMPHKVKK